jgi:glycosyltransferase involved in cell wall biosynthesis
MRILQIIDSLEVGGAEKMAVNYANALAPKIDFSGLVVTRKEGGLKSHINPEVPYLFLNKKQVFDIKAISKLKSFCQANQIDFVHAHGTSFFTAFLLKLRYPRIKIIWHEHYGARSSEKITKNLALWFSSFFFNGILVVDHTLENWCKTVLKFRQVLYLPNFTIFDKAENRVTFLKGEANKRILCLANLRHPKNHNLILEVAIKIKENHPKWTFHLVGKDSKDDYSKQLKETIALHHLEETVFIYGLREDTDHIIEQSTIAILTSFSEGLPVALLEYGLHKKAVVATNVGEIPLLISDGNNGFTVPSNEKELFFEALNTLIDTPDLILKFGNKLNETIKENHTESAVITKYLNWLKGI